MTDQKEPKVSDAVEKSKKEDPFQKEVELPSRGMFYGDQLPEGKVTIRPIKVLEEKLLAGGGNRMDLADKVLKRCIISECPELDDLLLTDKFYLLLNLRAISYGPEYSFSMKCGSCETDFKRTITLPEGLEVRAATKGDKEPFDVDLPVCKKKVSLRFLRGFDEKEIENYVRQLPNAGGEDGDPGYEFRMSRFIAKIDGEDIDPIEKVRFCEGLIGRDSLAIRQAIAEHETGPVMTIRAKCPGCQRDISTLFPLTSEFFPSGNV